MKLIIEMSGGKFYAYREENSTHKIVESKLDKDGGRKDLQKLDGELLDDECLLSTYEDSYFVFDIKKRGKK